MDDVYWHRSANGVSVWVHGRVKGLPQSLPKGYVKPGGAGGMLDPNREKSRKQKERSSVISSKAFLP